MPRLTRRTTLLGLAAAATLGPASLALASAATDRRFVVVILRGALDGMAAVVPYGDPDLRGLRMELVGAPPGSEGGVLDLGSFYGLHPSLSGLHGLYQTGELLPLHAVAGPYRTRSHFEGQDCLESGTDHAMTSGWLNRVVQALPRVAGSQSAGDAVAVGFSVPLLLRGPAVVGSWAPQGFATPDADLYVQVAALHRSDPITGPAMAEGMKERGFAAETLAGTEAGNRRAGFSSLAAAAGRFLRAPDGPRVAALELGGWDTHVDQVRRLESVLKQLDDGMAALKTSLGDAWSKTVVLVMTEFGRTARANGTGGTDHGTGTVCFVLGGAVAGGKVRATWPGLGPGKLFENRDLQPTTDLRAVAKGLLDQHLGLSGAALSRVFPGSDGVTPLSGLIRS